MPSRCGAMASYVGTARRSARGRLQPGDGQWIGRTIQNKTLNFHDVKLPATRRKAETLTGKYLDVLVTRAGPNSLAGQRVANLLRFCSSGE